MAVPDLMITQITAILSSRQVKIIRDPAAKAAAVLLVLLEKQDKVHVLLTRRSGQVAHHKGEISFPGGRKDPGDPDLLGTALRECDEEIGLRREDVRILGRLDDVRTRTTGFVVTPYVGVMDYPYAFKVNSIEIDDLIFVPMDLIASLKDGPMVCSSVRSSVAGPILRYQGHEIWGATARILKGFAELVCPLHGSA